MKTTTAVIVCLVALVFGFSAWAADIPGGIVGSNGNNVFYYGFKEKLAYNLGQGTKAASNEQGDAIIVLVGGRLVETKICIGQSSAFGPLAQPKWDTPNGINRGLNKDFYSNAVRNAVRDEPYLDPKGVKNLTISPLNPFGNSCIAYEHQAKGNKYIQVPQDSEIYNHGISPQTLKEDSKAAENLPRFFSGKYPRYVVRAIDFTSISVAKEPSCNPSLDAPWSLGHGEQEPLNLFCFRNPKTGREQSYEVVYNNKTYQCLKEGRMVACPREEMIRRHEEVRTRGVCDAKFPVWSSQLETDTSKLEYPVVAFIYHQVSNNKWGPIGIFGAVVNNCKEIPVSLSDCKGLAWKPDGTLTYADGKAIYSVNGKVLVDGINLTRYYWVSNDTFIFRNPEGALCFWKNGQTEKLLDAVPEEFSYCVRNPCAKVWTGKDKAKIWKPIPFNTYWDTTPCFQTSLIPGEAQGVSLIPPDDVWFAVPKETDLQKITNPASYTYYHRPKEARQVALNKVIILRAGNKFIAIKPVEIFPSEKKQTSNRPDFTGAYMVYEWALYRP